MTLSSSSKSGSSSSSSGKMTAGLLALTRMLILLHDPADSDMIVLALYHMA